MQSESETAKSKNNSLRSRAKEVGLKWSWQKYHFLSAGGLGQWSPELHEVALRGTKAISSNMWTETGQGNLSSYSTLGNTWVLGIISHNHPSGLSFLTWERRQGTLFFLRVGGQHLLLVVYLHQEYGQVSGRREGWILNSSSDTQTRSTHYYWLCNQLPTSPG